MRIGSLFSGIGGIEVGLESIGMETAWQCEVDPHASSILSNQWPDTWNLGDITKVDWNDVDPVDIICGGFPCQDISLAGKGAGIAEGTRSGLWSYFRDALGELRPRYAFIENVSALAVRGLDRVLCDLAEIGFDAQWTCVRASDVGAPHRRERLFVLATNTSSERREPWTGGASTSPDTNGQRQQRWAEPDGEPERSQQPASPGDDLDGLGQVAWGDYELAIRRWEAIVGHAPPPVDVRGRLNERFVEWMMGFPENWTDGISRAQQLKCLGNAVVPQAAVVAWLQLVKL